MSGGIDRVRLAEEPEALPAINVRDIFRRELANEREKTRTRLLKELRAWRMNHPHGFDARLKFQPNGTYNLMEWQCILPGRLGTDWEGGYFPLTIQFNLSYPFRAPKCNFPPGFLHPNVNPDSGEVCLRILAADWRPTFTVRQLLVDIQGILDQPNTWTVINGNDYRGHPSKYRESVREQTIKYSYPLPV